MKASLCCKCLTVLAALVVGRLSAVVTYEYGNKAINHYFHDTNAWNKLEIPTAGNKCQIAALDGNATTWVTNDYAEALASISFKGGSRSGEKNYELTFITRKGVEGTGEPTTFGLPDLPGDSAYVYGSMQFAAYENGDWPIFDLLNANTRNGPFAFTGVNLQLGNSNGTYIAKFNEGIFNFGDPNGAANGITLRFGATASGLVHQRISRFRPGTTLRYDKAQVANNTTDSFAANLVDFDGMTATGLTSFAMNNGVCNVFGGTTFDVPALSVNNGVFNVFDEGTVVSAPTSLAFSNNGTAVVSNGAHVTVGKLNFDGTSKLTVTGQGTTFTVEGKTTGSSTAGGELAVADGAIFTSVEDLGLASTKLTVTGGAKVVQEPRGHMSVAAPTNLVSGAGTFVYAVSNLTVGTGSALIIEQGAAVSAQALGTSGSNSRFVVGEEAALTNRAAISFGGGSLTAKPHAFIINGGVFNSLGSITMNNNSLIEVNGGEAYLQKAFANNLMMGWGSVTNAIVRINGGYAETSRVRMGRNSTATSHSRIELNGGRFKIPEYINFHQNNAEGNGLHELVLNGGVLEILWINAGDTDKVNDITDATVAAVLTGDGGMLRALGHRSTAAAPFIEAMRHAYCGDGGLTVDTQNFTVYFNHSIENKPGEEGFFRKVGEGTLILAPNAAAPAVTDVTTIDVAEGTLNVGGSLTLADTSIVVTNGATLSLAGAARNLTVSSLTLTDCVLELDPGDVITVTGAFDLQGVKINWMSLPEDEQSFLVVSGTLTEAQKKAIRRLCYENVLAAGKHAEFEVEYDEPSGTTTVKTRVANDTPLTETAVWTGAGAWATVENWRESVKPTETKKAVFGSDATGTEVELAAGDLAGALEFSGGNYRLWGGALAIEGYSGAAEIDVVEGSHAIDAPMELVTSVPIKLASGTELALNGRIDYGGLDKSGRGRLTLGGTLALGGQGFISRDGLVTVTNASALGATSADIAKFAAGTVEFAHPDGEPMTISAAVSGAAEEIGKTTLVFKVESDATLKNFANTNNRLLKRGAGVLTLDFDEARTITGLMTADLDTTSNIGCTYPADGSEPSGYRFPFGIAEGELKLVGRGEAPVTVTSRAKTLVGLPTEEAESSEASLTLDNIKFLSSNYALYVGYQTGNTNYRNRRATVRILNGSTLQVGAAVVVGYSSNYAAGRCQIAMTNGTYWIVAADGSLSRGGLESGQTANVEYLMNKSSFIVKTSIKTDGSTYMDADNGSYFGGENRTPMVLKYNDQNHARIYGELFFHNGSTLALSEIVETPDKNSKRTRDLVFAFNDAEWIYDAACGDKVWPVAEEGHNKYEMRGRGVILKPAAGKTFETREPFIGEGGVVNAGAGTVKFGEDAYQCAGTLEITEPTGTIDVSADDGTTHAIIPVKGKGTLKGAKATRITVKAAAEDDWTGISVPTLEDCTAGTVVIDMGRTAENPMSGTFPQNIAVAKWTGTGAVPAFKLRNTGLRNVGADFSVDPDGTVRMTPHETGIVLIVR